jgi:UDP-galactopyranose mutase
MNIFADKNKQKFTFSFDLNEVATIFGDSLTEKNYKDLVKK